jgi:DNA-binding helix-hairpin-helix protein with protein kinase domain
MLFRRASERGSEAGTRPRPAEWLAALKGLEKATVECAADPGHKYWRGAPSCVWCRLAEHGGPEYYFGVAGGVGAFVVDEAKLQEVLRRLSACGPFDFPYDRRRLAPAQAPEPEPLPAGVDEHRSTTIVLGVALGLCALALPLGLVAGAFCIAGSLGVLTFGTWLAIHFAISPWHREWRRRRRACRLALDGLNELEQQWQGRVRAYHHEHSELRRALQAWVTECRGLGPQYQAEMERLTANAEAAALVRHMRLHLIADADIPKIGAGRKQVLASYNIFTAADVEYHRIRAIKGFGDVLTGNLMAWREEVRRRFRFDRATAVSPAQQRPVTVQFRTRQQLILGVLGREVGKLESLMPACRAALQQLLPALQRAVAAYTKAEADLHLLSRKR